MKQNSTNSFVQLLLVLTLLTCLQQLVVVVMATKICSESIVMDSYFDNANRAADIQCSASEYKVLNSLDLVATFPYIPKGKIIRGSGMKVSAKYIFDPASPFQYQHTTSVFINDTFIMNLPFTTYSYCNGPITYSLDSYSQAITSYLDLGESNSFKITTLNSNPTVSLFLTQVTFGYCYVTNDTTIVDLVISSTVSSISLLTPSSFIQVKSEPFNGLYVNNMTDFATIPITVNNKAIDPAVNITISINSFSMLSRSIISLQNIRKVSGSNIIYIYPQIDNNTVSSSVISFTLYDVNLSYLESLMFDVNFQLNGSNGETPIDSSIKITVDSSNDNVEEMNSSDNSKTFSYSTFQTKQIQVYSESSSNTAMSSKNQVSDSAYFIHQPQSPFSNNNCWLQVNLFASNAFSGTMFIVSNRTMEQKKIPFTTQDFIGSRLFIVVPSDQLDCSGTSNTAIYVRLEAGSTSFRLYLSRKFYSTLNDDNLIINSIYTPKTESGEAFGLTVSTISKLESIPLLTNLTFINDDSSLDKFLAFNTLKSLSIELMSKSNGLSVPLNQFPNTLLSSKNVLYFFETKCISCTSNLTLTYPTQYSSPATVSLKTSGNQQQVKSYNGIHWLFLDTSRITSDTVRLSVVVTISAISTKSQPSKLSLLATQDVIDDSLNSNTGSTRSVQSTIFYNQTLNCNSSTFLSTNPTISISTPTVGKGTVWKYGLFIDPSYQYSKITFSYSASNYTNTVYSGSTNYLSPLSGDFYYTFNVDRIYLINSDLTIYLDQNLGIIDRKYDVYAKIGQKPTTTDYDMKISDMFFYNTTKTYTLRYSFSNTGTFSLQDSDIRLISNSKLDFVGQQVYLYFKEVPGSITTNIYSCYPKGVIYFKHGYTSTVRYNSDSVVYLSYPNLYLNASSLNISQSTVDKYINVEFTTSYIIPNEEKVYLVDWNTKELIPMNKTLFRYTTSYYDDDDNKYNYQTMLTKLNARMKITQNMVDMKTSLYLSVIFPSASYAKYTNNYAYVFMEEDANVQPETLPILIALAVMGGLFILGLLYLALCLFATCTRAKKEATVSANYDASLRAFAQGSSGSSGVSVFYDLVLLLAPALSKILFKVTKKKVHTIVSMIIIGIISLLLSFAFYAGLLISLGVGMSTLSNAEKDIIPNGSKLGNATYYACCKYNAPKQITTYATTMETPDRTLSCMKISSSTYTANLTINGELYQPSVGKNNYAIGGGSTIATAKLRCPGSEIIFLSSTFDQIPSLGIAGLVLGTLFLYLSVLFFSTSLGDYLLKKIVNDKWVFKSIFSTKSAKHRHHTNVTTHSNTSIAHSDTDSEENRRNHNIQVDDSVSRMQEENLRREREAMERIDREERLRREREARNQLLSEVTTLPPIPPSVNVTIPPEVKLPPPKPNQPTQVELTEFNNNTTSSTGSSTVAPSAPPLSETTPNLANNTNTTATNSNIFIYDNSNEPRNYNMNPTASVYNPYENSDDIVVFYQSTGQNNPQSQ